MQMSEIIMNIVVLRGGRELLEAQVSALIPCVSPASSLHLPGGQ